MASLFGGGAAPNTNAGKSLFDRITPASTTSAAASSATATTAPTAGGLFGSAAQPTQTSAGGLFGGLNNKTQPVQTSGGGLFGGANATSQTASTGATLFGGTLGATSQQPTTSGSNLFGGMNPTSKPATTSLFGAAQPPAASTNTGLFGASTQSQALQPAPSQTGPAESTLGFASNPAYFDQLLERGKKRQTEEHVTPFGDLPQLELGLADISRKVRNLGQGGPSAGLARNADVTKAHYLLAASGVNTSRALRDLDNLTGIAQPLYENELDGVYGVKRDLARKHRNDFQDMIDSHIKSAHDDFDKMIDEQLHGVDWTSHRQRIYEHFGLKKSQSDSDAPETGAFGRSKKGRSFGVSAGKSFGMSGLSKSVIGMPGIKGARQSQFADIAERMPPSDTFRSAPEDRVSRIRQEKYAERVKDLNVARILKEPYAILRRFGEVESDQPSENTAMLLNAYKALIKITGEDGDEPGKAVRARQYAEAYLDDASNSRTSLAVRKRILDGSRSFLEQHFYAQLEQTVADHPREANVGGKPTKVAKIKGYVRVRSARRELVSDVSILQEVDGNYCWVVIFYLLRSGLVKDAVTYVEENANAFRHIDRKFMNYLRHYAESPDRRLQPREQTDIHNDYSQRAKLAPEDSIDPYRMMCYKVIGRCDLARRSIDTINSDMEDFLWLQFSLAREYNRADELAADAYGLEEVRNTIKEIAERYFGPNSDIPNAPTTVFFMEILAGLFEKAVADLYAHNYVTAVHFAVALDYYGLLRVSDIKFSDDLLSYTTRQQPQLAFGSMIGLYTGDFRTAQPTAAADYLALICMNSDLAGELGRGQRELCHQALTELVLETREFAQLLGDIRADGQRIKGAIELRIKLIGLDDEKDFLRQITLVAARKAEENGRTTDAALLFHLAEEYDKVITIVNDSLSLALTTEIGEQPQKLMPLKPRTGENGQEVPNELQGSLSLTAVDDPVDLARNFSNLYDSSRMYYEQVKAINRGCCTLLLSLADARRAFEQGRWANAVDYINAAAVLPSEAHGNMVEIRNKANAFNEWPTVVARTIGHVMIEAVLACMNRVSELKRNEFESPHQQQAIRGFMETAKDIMLFAGLIRYKLPGRVWETLARAGQELGVY